MRSTGHLENEELGDRQIDKIDLTNIKTKKIIQSGLKRTLIRNLKKGKKRGNLDPKITKATVLKGPCGQGKMKLKRRER